MRIPKTIGYPLALIDVETTGASPTHDRIIDIAIIRIEEGKEVGRINSLIDPEKYVPESISALTGISEHELRKSPTFNDLREDILSLLDGALFVAHNARFDYGFLKNEFKRAGISFSAKCLCTVKLSRMLFPQYKRHDLSTIIDRYDFQCDSRHRAFPDAAVLGDFLSYIEEKVSSEQLHTHIKTVLKHNAIPSGLPQGLTNLLPETPGVYIFYGEEGEKLYIGKSKNIRTRVMSHFSSDHSRGKEMRISHEIRDIESIQTAGELGALLLESYLIKKEQPLYNRMSRYSRKIIEVKERINSEGYKEAFLENKPSEEIESGNTILFISRSQMQAKKTLGRIAEEYKLCVQLLDLEKSAKNFSKNRKNLAQSSLINTLSEPVSSRGCFNAQLGKCGGACKGKELADVYNKRFDEAFIDLRVKTWPYKGPILIEEKTVHTLGEGQLFIVDKWQIMCSIIYDEAGQKEFLPRQAYFDYDTYKILSRYLITNSNSVKIQSTKAIESFMNSLSGFHTKEEVTDKIIQ